jgi:FkbM family methyltransferase
MKVARLPIDSIIHVGANDGQERYFYAETGASPCIYVEPIDAVFKLLSKHISGLPGHVAVQAVCSDVSGDTVSFNIASNGGLSSSMLDLGAHATLHPTITYTGVQEMQTTTVDELIAKLGLKRPPNLMVVDTQGADLKVLKGSAELLKTVDGVFVEVSEEPLYEGGCTHDEISAFLRAFGLRERWRHITATGYGDAFYCRPPQPQEALPAYDGNKALGKRATQSSVSQWSKPDDAAGAVNGVRTGTYGFHTAEEDSPWWQVDLGKAQDLNEIRIYNRIDAGRGRSRTLRTLLSDDGKAWRVIADQDGYTFGGKDGHPLRVIATGEKARYVRLQLAERNVLHLDEVEVY